MTTLNSNADLYDYLQRLADILQSRGAKHLAAVIANARLQASGPSTEFLGESKIAIEAVLASENIVLSPAERGEASDVVAQLVRALMLRENGS
jgi:hypothetical protein